MNVSISRIESKDLVVDDNFDFTELIKDGWNIDYVNESEVIGMCEDCMRPILDGEEYNYDEEGITWHKSCQK